MCLVVRHSRSGFSPASSSSSSSLGGRQVGQKIFGRRKNERENAASFFCWRKWGKRKVSFICLEGKHLACKFRLGGGLPLSYTFRQRLDCGDFMGGKEGRKEGTKWMSRWQGRHGQRGIVKEIKIKAIIQICLLLSFFQHLD